MAHDLSSLDDFMDFNVNKNTRTVLAYGLSLSHAKDKDGQPHIDAASDAIAVGLDAAYTVARSEPGETRERLAEMAEVFIKTIQLIPHDDEPAMATLVRDV